MRTRSTAWLLARQQDLARELLTISHELVRRQTDLGEVVAQPKTLFEVFNIVEVEGMPTDVVTLVSPVEKVVIKNLGAFDVVEPIVGDLHVPVDHLPVEVSEVIDALCDEYPTDPAECKT